MYFSCIHYCKDYVVDEKHTLTNLEIIKRHIMMLTVTISIYVKLLASLMFILVSDFTDNKKEGKHLRKKFFTPKKE
jgi:hypothetical protein